jgi:hypothetical protein
MEDSTRTCKNCPFCDPNENCRCQEADAQKEIIPPEAGGDIEVDDYLGNPVIVS